MHKSLRQLDIETQEVKVKKSRRMDVNHVMLNIVTAVGVGTVVVIIIIYQN